MAPHHMQATKTLPSTHARTHTRTRATHARTPPLTPSPHPTPPRQAKLGPSLALLGSLAEEVEQQERARRSLCVAALEAGRTEVLALMQSLMLASLGGVAPAALVRPALQCLGHWLRLGGEESSGYALSPRQVLEQYPHMLQAGLRAPACICPAWLASGHLPASALLGWPQGTCLHLPCLL
jgi:hypothetical protein